MAVKKATTKRTVVTKGPLKLKPSFRTYISENYTGKKGFVPAEVVTFFSDLTKHVAEIGTTAYDNAKNLTLRVSTILLIRNDKGSVDILGTEYHCDGQVAEVIAYPENITVSGKSKPALTVDRLIDLLVSTVESNPIFMDSFNFIPDIEKQRYWIQVTDTELHIFLMPMLPFLYVPVTSPDSEHFGNMDALMDAMAVRYPVKYKGEALTPKFRRYTSAEINTMSVLASDRKSLSPLSELLNRIKSFAH